MGYLNTPYTVEQVKSIPNLYERSQDMIVSADVLPSQRGFIVVRASGLVRKAMQDPVAFVKENISRDIYEDSIGATTNAVKNSVAFLQSKGVSPQDINSAYQQAIPAAQSLISSVQSGKEDNFFGDLLPVLSIGLALFAPGIGGAIGSVLTGLAETAVASQVVGGAIVQGLLSEAQGGDFLDGAIKGAVTAGVAPAVANTVGTAVADVMADSAVKNVIANAVASSASSAVTAALTGGDVEQAALTGALAGGAGSVGRELGGETGAQIGKAAGAIAGGVDPTQAILDAVSKSIQGEKAPAAVTEPEKAPETPVSPPPGAEIAAAPPPQTPEIVDTGVMGGVAGTIPEITPPSTQEIPIPDQISQELGGVQEGVAGTIPPLDQELIDLITQPEIPVAQLPEVVITAPREEPIPGIQEGMAETIPADTEAVATPFEPPPVYDPTTATQLPEVVITAPREEPIPGIQEGMAETIPEDLGVQEGVAGTIPEDFGVQEGIAGTIPEDLGLQEGIAGTIPEDLGLQEGIAGTIPEEDTGVQEGIAGTIPETETVAEPTHYIRDTYISGGRRRGDTFGPTVTTLGQALAPPLFPSAPVSGLTSYRGAGEIEGKQTGKPRRDVWNEASLRLKDALGL